MGLFRSLQSLLFGHTDECVTEEQRWACATNPTWMVNAIRDDVSPRKLRLFAVACLRCRFSCVRCRFSCVQGVYGQDKAARMADMAERFAEGIASASELEVVRRENPTYILPETEIMVVANYACHPDARFAAVWTSEAATCAASVKLARCIFGNPFRPTTVNPGWLTWHDGVVRQIARTIYDEAGFDRLPILADALEEAGCTDGDWLAHCREAGMHGRGCWVVDLILGKA